VLKRHYISTSYVYQRVRKKGKGVYSPRKRHFLSLLEQIEAGIERDKGVDGFLTAEVKKLDE
jgi:hypothetical protein